MKNRMAIMLLVAGAVFVLIGIVKFTYPYFLSGSKEYTVTINVSEPWKNSGIPVKTGQIMHIVADGIFSINPDLTGLSPLGTPCDRQGRLSEYPSYSAWCGALVMRIIQHGVPSNNFYNIGDSKITEANADGELFFMVNDNFTHLSDNTGSITIKVRIEEPREQ